MGGEDGKARWRPSAIWRGETFRDAVVPFLGQRAVLFACVAFATTILPTKRGWIPLPTLPVLDPFVRWDSAFYLIIAEHSYGATPWVNPAPFFPFYPGIIRILATVMPAPLAALIAANVAAGVAVAVVYRVARHQYDRDFSRRVVWLLLFFPTSFFLSAAYSESIYLLAAAGVVYAWQRDRRLLAALAVFAGALSRPVGVVCLTVPFVVGWAVRNPRWRAFPVFVLAAVPALLFLLAMHELASGHLLGMLEGEWAIPLAGYAWPVQAPFWHILWVEGYGPNLMRRFLNWGALALVTAAVVALFRRRALELGLFVVLSVTVPMAFQASLFDATSMARYALVAFPIFFVIASWARRGSAARTVDVGFAMMQIVLAVIFATWRWGE